MELKNTVATPYNAVILVTGILFILLPILNFSPQVISFVGVVNLIALAINLKFRRFNLFAKLFVPAFNIIVFTLQLYTSIPFFSLGLNLNIYVTIFSSIVLLILNALILVYGG